MHFCSVAAKDISSGPSEATRDAQDVHTSAMDRLTLQTWENGSKHCNDCLELNYHYVKSIKKNLRRKFKQVRFI